MHSFHALIAGMCVVVAASAVQAQVLRCTDVRTGKVTYTDGNCASGTAAQEVEARKTPEDIQRERELAAEALQRKQQRQQAELEAAEAEERRAQRRDLALARRATQQPQDYAHSPECARSRRNLEQLAAGVYRSTYEQELQLDAAQRQVNLDCLGPQGYAEVEKARANQPRVVVVPPSRHRAPYPDPFPRTGPTPAPPHLVQCGDFRCTDDQGKTYPRVGPGRFPGAGGVCRSNGGQAPC